MEKGLVDHTALKFNQASIIVLLIVAYLLNQPWLVAFVGAVMLVGTIWPKQALFKQVYAKGFKPAGLLKPNPIPDDPRPHLFAQGVGALFLAASVAGFVLGSALVGWILAGIVVVLAAVNLFFGFCAGCFVYYQLARRGIEVDLPIWRIAQQN